MSFSPISKNKSVVAILNQCSKELSRVKYNKPTEFTVSMKNLSVKVSLCCSNLNCFSPPRSFTPGKGESIAIMHGLDRGSYAQISVSKELKNEITTIVNQIKSRFKELRKENESSEFWGMLRETMVKTAVIMTVLYLFSYNFGPLTRGRNLS